MKVGILTYSMLFQNEGGLQVQIRETIVGLRQLGIDASLVDVTRQKLADFDIIHVFAATQGNDKIVEQAKAKGCRVVLSSLINPSLVPPTGFSLRAVKFLSRVINRLSKWTVATNHDTVRKALTGADHVIVLSEWERRAVSKVYDVNPSAVTVVANGVSGHFFDADPSAFQAVHSIASPFVFCPAQISPWKNQKTLVEAMAGTGVTVVLAGPIFERDQAYLEACLTVPNALVTYIGHLDRNSAEFSGCYSAASIVVLPSKGESGPLVALEALAAGTPAVITNRNGLDFKPDGDCLTTINPFDILAIREAVLRVLAKPPSRESCRSSVAEYSWLQVTQQIVKIYAAQMQQRDLACVRAVTGPDPRQN